jgi:hypothetical protein
VRASIVTLVLVLATRVAAADDTPAEPLRISLECESYGRTKACPDFLRGFITGSKLLLDSPRASAQVVLYVATAMVAQTDKLHLRFVGQLDGAPPTVEIDVEIDSRATDDEQIAQLRPAFARGIALYVGALHPDAVNVEIVEPSGDGVVAKAKTTPWGFAVSTSGFGNWTGRYKSLDLYGSASLSRIEATNKAHLSVSANGGLVRRPALDVSGTEVSLDTTSWSISASTFVEKHLTACVSVAASTEVRRDDPKGQYRYLSDTTVGIEWDRFASDDPRGNVLAVGYFISYRIDGYNFPIEGNGRFAHYPLHKVAAAGRVRRDKISYGLGLGLEAEVIHPLRRHTISGSPSIEVKLGAHVDLSFSFSLTKRELPEPMIPEDDFEALSRGDYAEPFSASGSFGINIHWDRTNGAQNNRFEEL